MFFFIMSNKTNSHKCLYCQKDAIALYSLQDKPQDLHVVGQSIRFPQTGSLMGWRWFSNDMSQSDYSTAKCCSQISHPVANVFCIFLVCYTKVFKTSYLSHTPAHTCSQFGYTSPLLSSQW